MREFIHVLCFVLYILYMQTVGVSRISKSMIQFKFLLAQLFQTALANMFDCHIWIYKDPQIIGARPWQLSFTFSNYSLKRWWYFKATTWLYPGHFLQRFRHVLMTITKKKDWRKKNILQGFNNKKQMTEIQFVSNSSLSQVKSFPSKLCSQTNQ